jgi:carboxymethylenebutenolidase
VNTEELELSTPDGPMTVHVARPAGEQAGAVLVIPEAFGLNDHIREVTERCAAAGFVGIGLDIFHRCGGPTTTAPYSDFKQVFPLFNDLTDAGLLDDIDAATGYLAQIGFDAGRVGIVGFCFGGRVSFLAAVRRRLGGAVSFYGGGIVSQGALRGFPPLIDEAVSIETPWLGLFGDLDQSIPTEDVETLRAVMSAAAVDREIVRYPDADHGFHCDPRPSYNAEASKDAWERTMAWFGSRFA